ncbi:MAG: platelet-activating factor acetylhydrolase IB subunit [Nitrospiraceae bacterium]
MSRCLSRVRLFRIGLCGGFLALLLSGHAPSLSAEALPAAATPTPQTADWWLPRHDSKVRELAQHPVDLLFIGDSITQGWEDEGRAVWAAFYGKRRAANLGFNSDRTDHVLWRLTHGELEGITPQVVVLHIGTNNRGQRRESPAETAAGIDAIVATLHARLPSATVLVLGIFPRGGDADDPRRQHNDRVNALLSRTPDNAHRRFIDLRGRFLEQDGRISTDIMPDLLHLSEKGYRRWAEGLEPILTPLLNAHR